MGAKAFGKEARYEYCLVLFESTHGKRTMLPYRMSTYRGLQLVGLLRCAARADSGIHVLASDTIAKAHLDQALGTLIMQRVNKIHVRRHHSAERRHMTMVVHDIPDAA